MIKSIQGGPGIIVNNTGYSWPSFSNYSNNSIVGSMRYNGTTQKMEVYDGQSWLMIDISYPTVELSPTVRHTLDWAEKKMREEEELAKLCQEHPGLQEAYERLQIMKALTLEEKKNA